MKKIYLLVCGLILAATNVNAQCTGTIPGRYTDYIFPTYTIDSPTYTQYTTGTNMKMNIYQPVGDTSTSRPLVILAHGGAFIGGSRNVDTNETDLVIDTLCARFARRGYVTVSIDYRLTSAFNMLFAAPAADAVAKAISDGKAAIRYMVQHRSTYKIDTNSIFIGGNSAGAVLFMHTGYIENVADCSPLIVTALNNNGGLDGNSGWPGYTTKCKGVINLAGALNTVAVIRNNAVPSVNAQGDLDVTVPYNCGKPLSGTCPDTLCGLGVLEPTYVAKNVYHISRVFAAQPHVPWNGTDAAGQAMLKTVDSMVSLFMYNLVCTNIIVSVNDVRTNTDVSVFPNPATDVLNLSAAEMLSGVTVYDQMGRVVMEANNISKVNYELNTSRLTKGMYLVKVRFENENNLPVVRRVVIQ